MLVAPGPASRGLSARLAEALGAGTIQVESKVFPDGESYIRYVGDLKGEDVVVVQSCYPPQDKHLVELLLMARTARELGARRVVAAVPYLAYSRQDKRFLDGEAVSGRIVLELLRSVGVDLLVTVDVHNEEMLRGAPLEAVNVTAMPLIAEHLRGMGLKDPFILSPDRRREPAARAVAEALGTQHGWLEKARDLRTGEVETKARELPVEGRDVVIVDDIISTGGTIANAARIVKAQGARRVIAACTHPVLSPGSMERMRGAGVEAVIGTDSVEGPVSVVTVAPAIAEAVKLRLT